MSKILVAFGISSPGAVRDEGNNNMVIMLTVFN